MVLYKHILFVDIAETINHESNVVDGLFKMQMCAWLYKKEKRAHTRQQTVSGGMSQLNLVKMRSMQGCVVATTQDPHRLTVQ